MAIAVEHEDSAALADWGLGLDSMMEHCAFCGIGTRHWNLPSNNPVCQGCAETHNESELPVHAQVECPET